MNGRRRPSRTGQSAMTNSFQYFIRSIDYGRCSRSSSSRSIVFGTSAGKTATRPIHRGTIALGLTDRIRSSRSVPTEISTMGEDRSEETEKFHSGFRVLAISRDFLDRFETRRGRKGERSRETRSEIRRRDEVT